MLVAPSLQARQVRAGAAAEFRSKSILLNKVLGGSKISKPPGLDNRSMVSPGEVRRTATLFGKNGLFAPWFAGIAGSIMLYFRMLHQPGAPAHVALLAPLKAVPIVSLLLLALRLIEHGALAKYGQRIGCGLALSAVGDVLLEAEAAYGHEALFLGGGQPRSHPNPITHPHHPSHPIPGLVSFLCGHLAYIAAFSIGLGRADVRPIPALSFAAYAFGIVVYLR